MSSFSRPVKLELPVYNVNLGGNLKVGRDALHRPRLSRGLQPLNCPPFPHGGILARSFSTEWYV